jgi:hypothetical protein
LGVVQALAACAIEENGGIAKDVIDEAIHCRFGESAPLAFDAVEGTWSFDLFGEEVVDV